MSVTEQIVVGVGCCRRLVEVPRTFQCRGVNIWFRLSLSSGGQVVEVRCRVLRVLRYHRLAEALVAELDGSPTVFVNSKP